MTINTIAVVGMGYVGMPLAVAFATKHYKVIGFDTNTNKIKLYRSGIDPTKEVGDDVIDQTQVCFTDDPTTLNSADLIIIAVPTPVTDEHLPDLSPLEGACNIVGQHMKPNTIICFESTVYPGVTEDICAPLIENASKMKCGVDFKIAYSPERINPGDKLHTLQTIKKIVSGMDEDTAVTIQNVYNSVVDAGTFKVSNIKTAEAIKVTENTQRDVNIAFINEMALIYEKLGININEVVDGMNTKWNALKFRPGLVGGHCIGVDPYYLSFIAEKYNADNKLITSSRQINESMANHVVTETIKKMVLAGQTPKTAKVAVLGITFKENCPDCRNSKVYDIITGLNQYDIHPMIIDPWANSTEIETIYGTQLLTFNDIHDLDCIILAVAHNQFKEMQLHDIMKFYGNDDNHKKVLIDIKGIYAPNDLNATGLVWWQL